MTSINDNFYSGILAALAVVACYDEETLFREIVKTVHEDKLIKVARKDGAMRWSGLYRYRYGREEQP